VNCEHKCRKVDTRVKDFQMLGTQTRTSSRKQKEMTRTPIWGVGEVRSEHHGNTVSGTVNISTGHNNTVTKVQNAKAQVTWADVVRKPAVLSNVVKTPAVMPHGKVPATIAGMNSKIVLQRSFI
jgi:hypothetical protein